MLRLCNLIIALLLLAGISVAQDADAVDKTTNEETIHLLVQQVRDLQEKVRALEARPANSAASETVSVAPKPEEPSASVQQIVAGSNALHDLHGIQWRGFGEVDYKVLNQRQPEFATAGFVSGSAGNFFAGDFDLFLTSRINDKASVLAEMVISEGDAQSFDIGLDRVLLKYDYDDHLKMSFGRYHTGIGYYNTAFHTGKWLQTTVDRPLVMQFADEGGLLPTQAIGISVTGLVPSGKLGLNYILEYGSSDTIRPNIDDSGEVDDENNGNHVNLGLFIRPDAIPGLQVGGSIYHDKISDLSSGPSDVRYGQTIVNFHVVYVARGVEFLNEGFLIRHALEHGNSVFNTPAFYSQFSRRFGNIRPFLRYQYVNASQNSLFEDVLLRYGPSFGVRYDFNDYIAFKTQLDHTVRKGKPDLNGLQSQVAFTF